MSRSRYDESTKPGRLLVVKTPDRAITQDSPYKQGQDSRHESHFDSRVGWRARRTVEEQQPAASLPPLFKVLTQRRAVSHRRAYALIEHIVCLGFCTVTVENARRSHLRIVLIEIYYRTRPLFCNVCGRPHPMSSSLPLHFLSTHIHNKPKPVEYYKISGTTPALLVPH